MSDINNYRKKKTNDFFSDFKNKGKTISPVAEEMKNWRLKPEYSIMMSLYKLS